MKFNYIYNYNNISIYTNIHQTQMGTAISRISSIFSKKKYTMIMVGLDAAGKTTILYQLKLNDVISTSPTIGFNIEQIDYKNLQMTIWDIGGQDKLRPLWKHYYQNADAIIFVVDSADKTRFELVLNEIHRLMNEPDLEKVKLLIYANKQDLSNATSSRELIDILELRKLKQEWFIQPSSATHGRGLYEGLEWLSKNI
jgi:small GTP-binding protein